MTLYRCQAKLKHTSGLPRDDVSNTFFIQTAEAAGTYDLAEAAAEMVRDFYVALAPGQTEALMNTIAPSIATNGHEVRVTPIVVATNVDERGPGQPPVWTEPFDFVGRAAQTEGTPSEVAVCLSFRNNLASATPPAQRRGRIYFGPIEQEHIVPRAASTIVEPSAQLLANLRSAGLGLINNSNVLLNWVIYHRPREFRPETPRPGRPTLPELSALPGDTWTVLQVWTDNAFDTQRRRGERPTVKTIQ